jgi:glutathione peroxidase
LAARLTKRHHARMTIHETPVRALDGSPASLEAHRDEALLIVNVASRCGLTPQYATLEALHARYRDRGFSVVGVPCNQFMGQEPGSAEEIAEFCSATYGVSFPMLEKADVNGPDRHPLFEVLTDQPDADGQAGDVQWNFEKFLVAPGGEVVARFRPRTTPDDPVVVAAIEDVLPR